MMTEALLTHAELLAQPADDYMNAAQQQFFRTLLLSQRDELQNRIAEEFETLKFNSTKVQLAEWMRDTCLNPGQGDLVRESKGPDPVDPALLRALAGIGNNMNQIARRINTGEWDSLDVVKIVSALGAVERELAELRALHK